MKTPGPTQLAIDVEHRRGDFQLRVKLEAAAETVVLFGPSGSGKTSTLNIVAGLLKPDAGSIRLGDHVVFDSSSRIDVPTRRRGVGYVFQSYALFPHLTAEENVSFSLRGHPERLRLTRELMERTHVGHLSSRYPGELSGGQQQRVAIARALAVQPRLLLLDEPFAALDMGLRERLHTELRTLQRDLNFPVLYVTHNLADAFAVGDRIAVMQEGAVIQTGPVDEVFRHPADQQVAEIMGIRNLFRADVLESTAAGLRLNWDGLEIEAPPHAGEGESTLTVYLHPDDLKILYPGEPLSEAVSHNVVEGRILSHQRGPDFQSLRVRLTNDHVVESRFPNHAYAELSLDPGEKVQLSLRREGLRILERRSDLG